MPLGPIFDAEKKIYLQAHQKKLLVTFVISFSSLFRSFSLGPPPFGHFLLFSAFLHTLYTL